jgi:hypothetical protein
VPGQGEHPASLAGRDRQPQVDVPGRGPLTRQDEFVHTGNAARLGARQVGNHDGHNGVEDGLQGVTDAARVADVNALRQPHDSRSTAMRAGLLIRHISTLLMIQSWTGG